MVPHALTTSASNLLCFLPLRQNSFFLWPPRWSFDNWWLYDEIVGVERRFLNSWHWSYAWSVCGTIFGHMIIWFNQVIQISSAIMDCNHRVYTWNSFNLPLKARTRPPANIHKYWWVWMDLVHIIIWLAYKPRPAFVVCFYQSGLDFEAKNSRPRGCLTSAFWHLVHNFNSNAIDHLRDWEVSCLTDPWVEWLSGVGTHLAIPVTPKVRICPIRRR